MTFQFTPPELAQFAMLSGAAGAFFALVVCDLLWLAFDAVQAFRKSRIVGCVV